MIVIERQDSCSCWVIEFSDSEAVRVLQDLFGGSSIYLPASLSPTQVKELAVRLEQYIHPVPYGQELIKQANFTSRQGQVWQLLAEGFSNEEIAQKMTLESKSVENYINGLYQRLRLDESEHGAKRVMAALIFRGLVNLDSLPYLLKTAKLKRLVPSSKPGSSYPRWTEDEIDFLRANYQLVNNRKIAKTLGRTLASVRGKARELGLGPKPIGVRQQHGPGIQLVH